MTSDYIVVDTLASYRHHQSTLNHEITITLDQQ